MLQEPSNPTDSVPATPNRPETNWSKWSVIVALTGIIVTVILELAK